MTERLDTKVNKTTRLERNQVSIHPQPMLMMLSSNILVSMCSFDVKCQTTATTTKMVTSLRGRLHIVPFFLVAIEENIFNW